MKGDKKGVVHCISCYKVIKDIRHAYMDEYNEFHFMCDDCYEKLKPFFKGRNR